MPTAKEVYESSVSGLPLSERLRLAALILHELSESACALLDYSDAWSDEDLRDLSAFVRRYAATAYSEENDG